MALQDYLRKQEKSQINNLSLTYKCWKKEDNKKEQCELKGGNDKDQRNKRNRV